jgi:hypothetical protein
MSICNLKNFFRGLYPRTTVQGKGRRGKERENGRGKEGIRDIVGEEGSGMG